jgi:hypothetical protein
MVEIINHRDWLTLTATKVSQRWMSFRICQQSEKDGKEMVKKMRI